MKSVGFEVETFDSPFDFLKDTKKGRFDCLVFDVRMKGMTGIELHQQLIFAGLEIPTIFITAFDSLQTRNYVENSSVVKCLLKPFDDEFFLKVIYSVFD